jgi:hypothetical protein
MNGSGPMKCVWVVVTDSALVAGKDTDDQRPSVSLKEIVRRNADATEAAVDRLAELLPADALEDALKGLDPDVHHGAGRLADAARGPSDRDGARRRADRASRASAGRRGAEPGRSQRRRAQDAQHRSGIGRGPHAARPRRQLRAQTRGHAQTRVGRPWTVIASSPTTCCAGPACSASSTEPYAPPAPCAGDSSRCPAR